MPFVNLISQKNVVYQKNNTLLLINFLDNTVENKKILLIKNEEMILIK